MAISSESADTGAGKEPTPPSSRLRWLFLCVSVFLLALLLVSGVLVVRFLSEMRTEEMAATRALSERTRALSGLWLSIQSYDQAVQQFVAQTAADRDAEARRVDQLNLEIDADFLRYPSVRDSEEDALLNGMRRVFSQQRTLYISRFSRRGLPNAGVRRKACLPSTWCLSRSRFWTGRGNSRRGTESVSSTPIARAPASLPICREACPACSPSDSAAACCSCWVAWRTLCGSTG